MIFEAARKGYGISLAKLNPQEGGADAYARTFKTVDEFGQRYFVKTRPSVDPGMALCIALRDAGIEEVLAPMKTLEGRYFYPTEEGVLLVYPWIEGQNGFEQTPPLESWHRLGGALRKVHDSDIPVDQLSREDFRVPGVERFLELRDRLLSGGTSSETEVAIADLIRAHQERIEQVIERERQLGDTCRERELPLVPCHADVHMANVLVDTAGGVHIIDWDSPRLAPRECDLMFFFAPGILGRHGKAEEEAFFKGYGTYAFDPEVVDYYRHERALSDIVSFAHEATTMDSQAEEQKWTAVEYFRLLFEPSRPS